jgi:hypothetical protein
MFAWSIIWVNDGVERDLGVGGYAEESHWLVNMGGDSN